MKLSSDVRNIVVRSSVESAACFYEIKTLQFVEMLSWKPPNPWNIFVEAPAEVTSMKSFSNFPSVKAFVEVTSIEALVEDTSVEALAVVNSIEAYVEVASVGSMKASVDVTFMEAFLKVNAV